MKPAPWILEEDELLQRVWPMLGKRCAHMFPGRSLQGIRGRVKVLGQKVNMKRDFKNGEPGHRKGHTSTYKRVHKAVVLTQHSRDGLPMVCSVFELARYL